MSNADKVDYPYRGIPLKPAIVQHLVRRLYGGKVVERQVLVEEVTRMHLSEGGLKPTAEKHDSIFKRALSDMKDKGEAENASPGYWRISVLADASLDAPSVTTENSFLIDADEEATETTAVIESVAEIEIGEGAGAVYVYYLPTYRLRAEEHDEKSWPCKIGRTDRDPLARVLSQSATALPERPHIAIILRTNHPGAWEAALHGALTVRGMQIDNVPGIEWFLTSPDEIVGLIRAIDPRLFNQPAAYQATHSNGNDHES